MNGVVPSFPTELLQLVFSYLLLEDLKSAAMVTKRWQDAGEALKLWEDKKVDNQDDDWEAARLPVLLHCLQCKIAFHISEPWLGAVNMAHACSGAPGVIKVEEFLG